AVQTVIQINSSEPTGDILVFLPGQEEIDKSVDMINELALQLSKNAPLLVALPLYASLPPAKQQQVFEKLPPRRRKVIFATNVAETSLTISGVKYVVDTGLRKVKVWKHDLGLDTLLTTPISQASANQRMGRAGRESAGKCYRLFTEESYMELSKQTEPEILRCDVASAILMLKKAGINDVLNFQWLQSPGKKAIVASLMKLYSLKALGDDGKITSLGVLSPCIDIVSCLSIENLLLNPHPEKRDEVNELRRNLCAQGVIYGDLAMLKQMFDGYQKIKNKHERKQWCKDIAVNSRGMKNVAEVRKQLRRYMLAFSTNDSPIDFDYEDQENRENQLDMKQVLKCFLRGYIGNTALGMPDRRYRTVVNGQTISIHPSSMMFGRRVEAIMYTEYVFTTKGYARTVCPIELSWLQEIAPHYLGRRVTSNED
ncbi:P-loop containing nucleoside triphosphate hydrolase protein, partial [Nadsonia fulvescens var. elongata DSM 6958]